MSINELRGLYPFSPQDVLNVRSQLGVLTTDGGQTISSAINSGITIESTGGNWPAVTFNNTASPSTPSIAGRISASKGGVLRWTIDLGTFDPELGGNTGSYFQITPYNDAGTALTPAVVITRTGAETHYTSLFQVSTFANGANNFQFRPSDTAFPYMSGGNNVSTIRLSPSICIGLTDLMPTISSGNGAPAATAPPIGSMYLRTDGGVATRVYIKQTASTWAAIAGV